MIGVPNVWLTGAEPEQRESSMGSGKKNKAQAVASSEGRLVDILLQSFPHLISFAGDENDREDQEEEDLSQASKG